MSVIYNRRVKSQDDTTNNKEPKTWLILLSWNQDRMQVGI